MKNNNLIILVFLVSVLIAFVSCKKENVNETLISSNNENESHNSGNNCMNCHISGGQGSGWFTIAGTVYDSLQASTYPNVEVKLYTGQNGTGTEIKTIQVDGLGNFYTTEEITFGDGLYVAVIGTSATMFMNSKVQNGQCNSCHGGTTDKIWTK